MTKLNLTIFLALYSFIVFSQGKKISAESISDCGGAMNIFKSGNYSIQFTGDGGKTNELVNYPSLKDISDDNIVWISYIAENEGTLSFDASISQNFLQMIVFIETKSNICIELSNGTAEIKRFINSKSFTKVGLNKTVSTSSLYPLELMEGQKILIAFATLEKTKPLLKFDFLFTEKNIGLASVAESKIIDNRHDEFAPTFSIIVRDSQTNQPINANLTIEGSKELAALYRGSDLLFNVSKSSKIFIKCDAEGYFFIDKEILVLQSTNQEIVLKMERLAKGKSLQIEEIEFVPGSSEFVPGSESKLNRLKDLMALNADIHIEIQGHVFSTGENNFANQQMSEVRAKRVMNYLVSNGISKERMTAVGYGNTKPIYPQPKLAYEEQANRRVEIMVK